MIRRHKKSSSTSNLKRECYKVFEDLENSSLSKNGQQNLNKGLLNEFICNCCFDIIDNPISLTCGHSSCEIW